MCSGNQKTVLWTSFFFLDHRTALGLEWCRATSGSLGLIGVWTDSLCSWCRSAWRMVAGGFQALLGDVLAGMIFGLLCAICRGLIGAFLNWLAFVSVCVLIGEIFRLRVLFVCAFRVCRDCAWFLNLLG